MDVSAAAMRRSHRHLDRHGDIVVKLANSLFIIVALALPSLAFALPVNLSSPFSVFSDAVGGTDVVYSPAGTASQVRWGDPTGKFGTGDDFKSGLGFDIFTAPMETTTGTAFGLGTLSHFNWEVKNGTAASGVQLSFGFTITDPSIGPVNFNVPFAIDETANSAPCARNPVPIHNFCPDIITFSGATSTQSFTIGGVDYTLFLLGFGPDPSDIQSDFITQEGGVNTTRLWAKIDVTMPPVDVPEPNALLLLAFGLLALGGAVQLRRKQDEV